jgi:hypothetical protein
MNPEFTQSEWELLGNAPLAAGAAVAVAAVGGGQREAEALLAAWRDGARLFAGSPLLQRLIVELDPQSREERERAALQGAYGTAPTFDQIVDEAVALASRAVTLVETRADSDEADAYKTFVMHIITAVAQSEHEGGLFGVGGQPVSPAERDVIRELALALRYRGA